jgi:hypothetical protein
MSGFAHVSESGRLRPSFWNANVCRAMFLFLQHVSQLTIATPVDHGQVICKWDIVAEYVSRCGSTASTNWICQLLKTMSSLRHCRPIEQMSIPNRYGAGSS